ncbi:MAG: T9SS type A sorting domain-containing protein [Bacteroidetes bacterium]|nr:T9SS type A sorting domain-containing protein [Bacteroidota bacterium]
MKPTRLLVLLIALCILAGDTLVVHAQYRRRDISTLSAADQLELRQLMMGWINAAVVAQHYTAGIHCYNEFFLSWHRGYIGQLEAWLMTQPNGTKYVPLPKWDPNNPAGIPNAFFNGLAGFGSSVLTGYPPLVNQNISGFGNFNFGPFIVPGVCAAYPASTRPDQCTGIPYPATAIDNFALALENQHNPVHPDVGGVMSTFDSPAAALFFLWHGYIDDHYRYYQCVCQNAKVKDLYMKDNPADIGGEPNTTEPSGVMWQSPDIWVRQNADPFVGGKYQHEDDVNRHQNPEYKTIGQNYVYVRIRNLGCQTVNAGEVNLRVYWSKASSGVWTWPGDWTNTPPFTPPHGDEITLAPIPVPTLAPGAQWVGQVGWTVPNPALYPSDPHHFCLLARLESAVDPMTYPEGSSVYANTQNNNNIAWRNVMVYDLDPNNIVGPVKNWDKFFFALTDKRATAGKLRFDLPNNPALRFTVDLGQELHDAWVAGGRVGDGVDNAEGTQVVITGPTATLENIKMKQGALYTPAVQANLENNKAGGLPDVKYGDVLSVVVTQYETIPAQAEGENDKDIMIGGLTYDLRAVKLDATNGDPLIGSVSVGPTTCPEAADGSISLVMKNPDANYTYWWSTGASTRDVTDLAAGTYTVYVRNDAGVVETQDITVKSSSSLAVDMDATISSCGRSNGATRVGVTGGKAPYTYQWYKDGEVLGGETGTSVKNAAEGNYSVAVTDAAGCSVTGRIRVSDEMAMLNLFVTTHDASSADAADGSADAEATGMMPPFQYQWSNGSTSPRISGLVPGVYTVSVTDASGCSVSQQVTISYPQLQNQGVDRENANALGSILLVSPNPATDRADVRYELRKSGSVKIALYDEVGRLVDVLYDGQREEGGNTLNVDTRSYPSGRYTVRLLFGGTSASMPLVIVR